jgi:hypothetical protein
MGKEQNYAITFRYTRALFDWTVRPQFEIRTRVLPQSCLIRAPHLWSQLRSYFVLGIRIADEFGRTLRYRIPGSEKEW